MSMASDSALATVGRCNEPLEEEMSDHASLAEAVNVIIERLSKAKTAAILPGYLISRLGLKTEATALVEASGLPFATMFMDKTCLDESHPQYMGIYCGRLMDPEVADMVESCDVVLNIGAFWSDFNTGAYTAKIDPARMISVMHHHVKIGGAVYSNVEMRDVIIALTKKVRKMQVKGPKDTGLGEPVGSPAGKITPAYLYPRYEKFLRPNDIVIAETGTSSQGMGFARMPKGAAFHNQTLWGAIGWATPAAFGAALAAPDRRVLLFTGEGSHQMTAQDICQFHRFGLKPIIFTLNNNGYLIERILCKEPSTYYNDIAQWEYHKLPEALGCRGWFAAKVKTNAELEEALSGAERCGTGAYIEVVMDKMALPPMGKKMHENLAALYGRK
jgi:indolepyruvate decarboxylase